MESPLNPYSSIINKSFLELRKCSLSLITLLLQASILILISEITLNASSVYSESNENNSNYSKEEFLRVIISFIAIYIIYISFALFSNEFRLVGQLNSTQPIYEKLKNYFEKPIKISFNTYSFNYISDGKKFNFFQKGKMKKVISHFEKEKLIFLSSRDISGVFDLDSQRLTKSENRIWINLKLKLEYEFADELSRKDFNTQKDFLISRNSKKDFFMDFVEENYLSDFEPEVLVHLGNKNDFMLNKYFFLLFTLIIPVIEIYKIFLNSKVKFYNLTIRKIISTRYNLKEKQFDDIFHTKNPKLIIKEKEFNYENIAFENQRMYELPTLEEIKNARSLNENLIRQIHEYNIHFGFSPLKINEVKLEINHDININKKENEINLEIKQIESKEESKNQNIDSELGLNNVNKIGEDSYEKEFKGPTRSYSTSDTINQDLTILNRNEIKREDIENNLIQ